MEKTDWRWCYENPKEAAAKIDALQQQVEILIKRILSNKFGKKK